jgi:hypothetical protein
LLSLTLDDFESGFKRGENATKFVRQFIRSLLREASDVDFDALEAPNPFERNGEEVIREQVLDPLRKIGASYFGMLQGRWPIHLLSSEPLSARHFAQGDVRSCKLYGREANRWSFVPVDARSDSDDWFKLEFDLPEEIARLVEGAQGDRNQIGHIKREHFSYISVSGLIGEIRRQIRLELDPEWIHTYLERSA